MAAFFHDHLDTNCMCYDVWTGGFEAINTAAEYDASSNQDIKTHTLAFYIIVCFSHADFV
jgi:hypothetical protein